MKQDIIQLGAAVLRAKAKKITEIERADVKSIIDNLLCTLDDSDGVGIAAPQINQSYCILIIASKPTVRYPNAPVMLPTIMINPSFKTVDDRQQKDWEGCLSIPGIRALVPRYQHISVSYQDIKGCYQVLELDGFVARIFQHEYDHLQGLVYLDRVEDNQDIISETEFYKLLNTNQKNI